MTQTCTLANTQELQLVNIISISEDKLQSNFLKLLNRLNHHEKLIQLNSQASENNSKVFQQFQFHVQSKFQALNQGLASKFDGIANQFVQLNNTIEVERKRIGANEQSIKKIFEAEEIIKGQIMEEESARESAVVEIDSQIKIIRLELESIEKNLETKQTINQCEVMRKSMEGLKKIIEKIEEKQKFTEYKLEKIQILNQKADKAQKNKEVQLMKEMEDKIKQSVRVSQSKKGEQNLDPSKKPIPRTSNIYGAVGAVGAVGGIGDDKHFLGNPTLNPNNKLMTQLSDKVESLEKKFTLSEEKQKKEQKNGSNLDKNEINDLLQKICQIKPELIKLWAKCDSLEDKSVFTERKIDQQGKNIQILEDIQKDSPFSKIQEKLKMFQTQFYANMKELKTKIEAKVSLTDYQKNSKAVSQRLMGLAEQVLLKSDKLQVKKALLFLESKIKEIILVISEDEQNEKDALITKKQIKCISCDKDLDKFMGMTSNSRGNWDSMPQKEHTPQVLGRFGMTSYGSLAKKIKKLDGKDLPILSAKKNKEVSYSEHRMNNP